jgi:transcriptional regulator with XRE-family HTH domain
MKFQKKKIIGQSLGCKFSEARKEQGLSVTEVSEKIHVAKRYLNAIEGSDYSKLPADVYALSFVKNYATFLGLPCKEMVQEYKSERSIFENIGEMVQKDVTQPVTRASRIHFFVTPAIVKGFLVFCIAGVCMMYLGLKVEAIVRPPTLSIFTPEDNILVKEGVITFSGKTELEARLEINGQKVLVDEDGYFDEQLDVQPGLNVITVSARRDHSKENVIERKVVFQAAGFVDNESSKEEAHAKVIIEEIKEEENFEF